MTRYSAPQILAILRQADGGVPVSELCREHGMHGPAEYCETMFERGQRVVLQMAVKVWRNGCVDDQPDEGLGVRRKRHCSECAAEREPASQELKGTEKAPVEPFPRTTYAEMSMQAELLKEALGKM
jgi:putative transposase